MFNRFLALQAMMTTLTFAVAQRTKQARDDERGVVSIEYLVLGAALIVLIGVLGSSSTVQQALQDAFTGLFGDAAG